MQNIDTTARAKRAWSLTVDGPPLLAVALVFSFLVSLAVGTSRPMLATALLGLLLLVVTSLEFLAWLRQTRADRLVADEDAETLQARLRAAEKRRLQEAWI